MSPPSHQLELHFQEVGEVTKYFGIEDFTRRRQSAGVERTEADNVLSEMVAMRYCFSLIK